MRLLHDRVHVTITIDRQVLHPAHQRPGDGVVKHLLLRREAHQAVGVARPVPDHDEVEVADVVAGQHRRPLARDVLGP